MPYRRLVNPVTWTGTGLSVVELFPKLLLGDAVRRRLVLVLFIQRPVASRVGTCHDQAHHHRLDEDGLLGGVGVRKLRQNSAGAEVSPRRPMTASPQHCITA